MSKSRIESVSYAGRGMQECYDVLVKNSVSANADDVYCDSSDWSSTGGVKRSPLYPTAVRVNEIDNLALNARLEEISASDLCEAFPIIEVIPAVTGQVHTVTLEVQVDNAEWISRGWSAVNDAFRTTWLRMDHKGVVVTDSDGVDLEVAFEKYAAGMVQSYQVVSKPVVDAKDGSQSSVRTRWFVVDTSTPSPVLHMPRWECGHTTRAEAKKDAVSRGVGSYDIIGIARREDGSPVQHIEVSPPKSSRVRMEVTATVREVVEPEQVTGRQGWYIYGWSR